MGLFSKLFSRRCTFSSIGVSLCVLRISFALSVSQYFPISPPSSLSSHYPRLYLCLVPYLPYLLCPGDVLILLWFNVNYMFYICYRLVSSCPVNAIIFGHSHADIVDITMSCVRSRYFIVLREILNEGHNMVQFKEHFELNDSKELKDVIFEFIHPL